MKYCPNPGCPHRREVGKTATYEDSATTCSDCGTALVTEEPVFPPPPFMAWDEMVPLMHVSQPALVPVIEGLLEAEGIRHYIHGANVQDLFGAGRIGSGFNVIAGQPVLFVESERADEVRQLLGEHPDVPFDLD